MFEELYIRSLEARGIILNIEDFTLPSYIKPEKVHTPLIVALLAGFMLHIIGPNFFTQNENKYWLACILWFTINEIFVARQRALLIDAYRVYLDRFSDEELSKIKEFPLSDLAISLKTQTIVAEELNKRRKRANNP